MNFDQLLGSCKFLFQWKSESDHKELEIVAIHRDRLEFKDSFPLPGGNCPAVTIGLQIKNKWYEHSFEQTEWLVGESGQIDGMRLLGPESSLFEWKKNLEIGLCV